MKVIAIGIGLLALSFDVALAQQARRPSEDEVIEQLGTASPAARVAALQSIRAMRPESVGPALRNELMRELERVNAIHRESLATGVALAEIESPEYIAELQRVVAELKDPEAIPALADSLGLFTIVGHLADMGEQSAPALVDVVTDSASHYTTVDDGLRALRMMVEAEKARPLSAETLSRIRDAAEQRLSGQQYFTTVWYAIDLAIVLRDPELRRKVEVIAADTSEVSSFGISSARLIERTQQRARDRLAGEPPRPRREDVPPKVPE